ncbi:MAG: hypothetical protein RQ824_06680 [bacterium]|nr:hypothetical protein [bacterium]
MIAIKKFRYKLFLALLVAALMQAIFFNTFTLNLYSFSMMQIFILLTLHLYILKLYRSKKKLIVEGEKKRYEILDNYIIDIKESADYGINLIPVLVKSLEGVVAQTEEAALTIGKNFGRIVKNSRDGAEEADAVVDYLLGGKDEGDGEFGESYIAGVLNENRESFRAALMDLEKFDSAGKEMLKEFETISDEFIGESFNNLKTSIHNVSESVNVLSRIYDNISEEIEAVIISLQFQDITKQKVEHVVAPLLKLGEKLETVSQAAAVGDRLINAWEAKDLVLDDLDQMYTMEEERKIMNEVLVKKEAQADKPAGSLSNGLPSISFGKAEAPKKDGLDNNVELF